MSPRPRSWLDGKRRFAFPWRPGSQIDRDVDEELGLHLDLRVDELVAGGMDDERARRTALEEFGDLEAARRDLRRLDRSVEQRRRRTLVFEEVWRDVVQAVRSFGRQPGFFVTTVLILALGLGSTTAMFQLVNLLALQPILVERPGELVTFYNRNVDQPGRYRAFSYPDFRDLVEQNRSLEAVAAQNISIVGVREGETTRRVLAGLVSESFFATLGVRPAAGRAFTAEEQVPDSAVPVVVLSDALHSRLGAGESLIGETVTVNELDLDVVGVMPAGFTGTTAMFSPELWLPLGLDSSLSRFGQRPRTLADRGNNALLLFGRRKPGRSLDDVSADVGLVGARLAEAYPDHNQDFTIEAGSMTRLSLSTQPASDAAVLAPAALLLAMGVVVLLIACLNLANMQLARGSARASELAVRSALGGGRGRLIRQLLTEGLVLSLAGGLLGLVLAGWVIRVFFGSLVGMLPLGVALNWTARPDLIVLLATGAFCLLATLVFGLGPALRLTGGSVIRGLRAGGRDGHDSGSARMAPRQLFLVAQIALSLVLLVAGGLVARGASRTADTGPGFDVDDAVLIDLDPSLAGADEVAGREIYRRVLETVRGEPGIDGVGLTSIVPFGSVSTSRPVFGAENEDVPESTVTAHLDVIDSGYFDAIGLRVLQGRGFSRREDVADDSTRVVIVDQPLAEKLWPGESPVGRSLRFSNATGPLVGEHLVVGVVPGVRQQIWDESAPPHVYLPFGQNYTAAMTIHAKVSSGRDAAEAIEGLRREITRASPQLALFDARTWETHRQSNVFLWGIEALGRLLSIFGLLALVLAVVGVYGVRSFLMTRRTREFGLRLALGATPRDILGMAVREGARLTAIAAVLGILLSLGVGRLLSSVIRGVETVDPLVLVLSLVVLLVGTTVASFLPARRATRVSPTLALRAD